jgi:hypothetical protein
MVGRRKTCNPRRFSPAKSCQDRRQNGAIMRDSQFAKNNKARAWHDIHDTCAQITDQGEKQSRMELAVCKAGDASKSPSRQATLL